MFCSAPSGAHLTWRWIRLAQWAQTYIWPLGALQVSPLLGNVLNISFFCHTFLALFMEPHVLCGPAWKPVCGPVWKGPHRNVRIQPEADKTVYKSRP